MTDKRSVEELGTIVSNFKNDAQFLYRYGDLSSSGVLFGSLTLNDRKKVIYLALSRGDRDIGNVANELTNRFKIAYKDKEELLSQIPQEEREELMPISPLNSAKKDSDIEQLKEDSTPSKDGIQSSYQLTPVAKFFLNMSFADLLQTNHILRSFQEGTELTADQLKSLEENGFIE